MGALGGVLAGVYLWQPLRLDLSPFGPEASADGAGPGEAELFRPGARVVIVTAHPDDTEFYVGGTLLRLAEAGAETTLIVTTDGDKGYYPFGGEAGLAQVRRAEQDAAAAIWDARETLYFGGRDGRLRQDETLMARLEAEFRRLRPEFLLTLDGEYPPRFSHRDHHVTGRAAEDAAQRIGSPLWLMRFSTRAPTRAFDVTAEWERRMALLPLHRSQFKGRRLQTVRGIIARNAEREGALLGVRQAEGFRCERLEMPAVQGRDVIQ